MFIIEGKLNNNEILNLKKKLRLLKKNLAIENKTFNEKIIEKIGKSQK